MKYENISASTKEDLDYYARCFIVEGWEPQGGISCCAIPVEIIDGRSINYMMEYNQTMIKREVKHENK